MSTAPEQTRFPAAHADTAEPAVPTAGRAPVATPAAGYVGTLIAVLILGLGVIALAAQKHHYALYLNAVYASPELTARLRDGYAAAGTKLDMGKSCIRFKRADDLALDLIRDEIAATTPKQFIAMYERIKPPKA